MTHTDDATKPCSQCGEEKPLPDFRTDPRGLHERRSQCRQCENVMRKAREARAPRPKLAQKKIAGDVRDRRSYRLGYYYGITEEQHAAILAGQAGRCYVCQEEYPAEGLYVDHDHTCCPGRRSCGQCVRGLLCQACNHAIGQFRDDPERLLRAVAYLVAPPAPAILTREAAR